MNPNELRLGNWIWATGMVGSKRNEHETRPIQVTADTFKIMERSLEKYYAPVKVTADILLLNGFKLWRPEDYRKPHYHLEHSFIIATTDKGFQYWFHNDQDDYFDFDWTELNTVHELQNFYFALYKKELEIKI